MAESPFAIGSDDSPTGRARVFFEADFEAGGGHVDFAGLEGNRLLAAVLGPPDFLAKDVRAGVVGDIDQVGEIFVDAVALWLHLHHVAVVVDDVVECASVYGPAIGLILIASAVAGKGDRPAGVFFFDVAVQVGREANLGFHFFLAVTVVIVREHRDDHASFGSARELERLAFVVSLGLVPPAHPIAALPFGCIIEVRQAELFFRE